VLLFFKKKGGRKEVPGCPFHQTGEKRPTESSSLRKEKREILSPNASTIEKRKKTSLKDSKTPWKQSRNEAPPPVNSSEGKKKREGGLETVKGEKTI